MPTYVYRFVDTGETIEVQQAFTDDTLSEAVHPSSGELMAVRKVFQPVGVTFKGGGFYKTDSRTGGSSSRAKDSTTTSSDSSTTSSDGAGSTSSSDGGSTGTTPTSTTSSSTSSTSTSTSAASSGSSSD